jgi:putative colanic acid biosynthesis acetyltransferase WcaF
MKSSRLHVDRLSVDLARYDNSAYDPGRSFLVRLAWFSIGSPLLRCALIPSSAFRRSLLRAFGAEIGTGTVMQQPFSVKYPWNLRVGAHSWFGEHCWIDNLAPVTIGSNVCISQAAYFCTGNHDWSDPVFALRTRPIKIGDGAWIGARASLAPGVVIGEGAVVALGSVVSKSIPAYEIHSGNPACFVRMRELKIPDGACDALTGVTALSSQF